LSLGKQDLVEGITRISNYTIYELSDQKLSTFNNIPIST